MTRRLLFLFAATLAFSAASDEAEIRALEHRWDEATLKGDAQGLAAIFDDKYIETGSDGRVRAKSEVIHALSGGDIKYQAAKTEDVRVILYGDAAIVSGIWRGKFTNKGKPIELAERFTNVYVRRSGSWKCVASHGSSLGK